MAHTPVHLHMFACLVSFGLLGVRVCVFFLFRLWRETVSVGVIGRVGQLYPDTLVWFASLWFLV